VAKKISAKRAGLLQLMIDKTAERAKSGMQNDLICFSSYNGLELEKYGLTCWDTATITWAEKAGHIELHRHGMYRITEAGKKALEEYRASINQ